MVAPSLTKDLWFQDTICAEERVFVTLRHVVMWDSHTIISLNKRMNLTTVGRIIKETCSVIWDTLFLKGYLKAPTSKNQWKKIAKDFEKRWNFDNCFGAIDGKHAVIQAPQRAGSIYNYKATYSIVIMAVVRANYEFTLVDIDDVGCKSNGGVFLALI